MRFGMPMTFKGLAGPTSAAPARRLDHGVSGRFASGRAPKVNRCISMQQ
jgi:hypothetical protein